MEDNRKAGFSMNIIFEDDDIDSDITPSEWIKKYSGFMDDDYDLNFVDKILSFNKTGNRLSIIFDSESNCFDVMQSLFFDGVEHNSEQEEPTVAYLVKSIEVSKSGKKLRVIKVHPSGESELFTLRNIKKRLEKFGLVLAVQRDKKDGICSGTMYALVVFHDENTIFSDEEQDLAEVACDLNCFGGWYHEKTEKLWKMFNEFVEKTMVKNYEKLNESAAW